MKMLAGLLAIAGIAAAAMGSAAAQAADLEVTVTGLRTTEGHVRVALYRRAPNLDFPGRKSVTAVRSHPAAIGSVRVSFPDLPAGDYAIAAFHDADGDTKLNRNLIGIPTEGYGFSNGAVGFMGPPSFDQAAFRIGETDGPVSVSVPIGYWRS